MHEKQASAQWLCASAQLLEADAAVMFEVREWGRTVPAFALRVGAVPVAYLNRCAHAPAQMDWQPGQFWDADRRYIVCALHGAHYQPSNGLCVLGPCRGASLTSIPLLEQEGQVYWYPSDRFQPVV